MCPVHGLSLCKCQSSLLGSRPMVWHMVTDGPSAFIIALSKLPFWPLLGSLIG